MSKIYISIKTSIHLKDNWLQIKNINLNLLNLINLYLRVNLIQHTRDLQIKLKINPAQWLKTWMQDKHIAIKNKKEILQIPKHMKCEEIVQIKSEIKTITHKR